MTGGGAFRSLVVALIVWLFIGTTYSQSVDSCYTSSIGNGECDAENNNEYCDYDGGDCCDCTSDDGGWYDYYYGSSFSSSGTVCRDPDSECVHPYPECTDGYLPWIGDGWCDMMNNNERCGYDGGDCCECSCIDGYFPCGVVGYFCLDPHAPSDVYNCEDRPIAIPACEVGGQSNWVVSTTSDVQSLVEALKCSGGAFQVTWMGHIVVNETIYVLDATVLNVTGGGPVATIDGASETRLFTVVNASLHLNSVGMMDGSATSGGAIGASASVLTFKNVEFIGNRASVYGGALFLSGGSNVSFDGPSQFVGNFASLGGAMFVKEGSKISWAMSSLFSRNSAALVGGAVLFTGGSSGLWSGPANFTLNTAFYRGGALYVVDGSNILWTGETGFWENQACGYGIGGALFIAKYSTVSWTGKTIFSGNKAWYSGGAIYVSTDSVVSWVEPTEFIRNTAGAYFTTDDGDDSSWSTSSLWNQDCVSPWPLTSWSSSSSDDNSNDYSDSSTSSSWNSGSSSDSYSYWFYDYADSSSSYFNDDSYYSEYDVSEGGAIYVSDHSYVYWTAETMFLENSADIGGAVFITSGSTVEWNDSTTFSSNAATSDGGAVGSRVRDTTPASSSSSFNSSSSSYNWSDIIIPTIGADDDESWLIIGGGTVFVGNRCGASGGGLALLGTLALTINSTNVTFSGNSAYVAGGAVFISSTAVGPEFTGAIFIANSAPVGGAVFASGSGTKKTDQSDRGIGYYNFEDPTTFRNCKFINNEADAAGGAVESASGRDIFIETIFKGNKASVGGALRLTGAAKISLCIFEDNKSDAGWGPAVAYFGTSLDIHDSTFINNIFSCRYGTYLDFNESGNLFETVCKKCGEECPSCEYGEMAEVPDECVPLSEVGLDEHAESNGGPLSELIIDKGYWRATSKGTRLLECYHENACQGGVTNTDQFCAPGYKGPYCAVCIEDWYTSSVAFKCKKCSNDEKIWGIVVAAILGVFAVLCIFLTYCHLMSGEVGGTGQSIADRVIRRVPLQAVKIIIVAWQIESQFSSAANVEYPPIYSEFLERVVWVDFNWSRLISAGCLLDISFYDRLLILTIAPIVILVLLMVTYVIATRKHGGSERALRTVRSKHMSMVLLVTFLVYSSASTIVFQMFDCEDLEDNKTYNRADYSVECDTDLHNKLEWYAGFMILVYPIGIPVFYAFLLFRNRDILVNKIRRQSEPSVESTSDLWAPYKPSRFFYEVLECSRRVLLTGVVLLLEGDTAAQIAVTFMVAVSFAFVFEGLDPYESRWDTWIGRMGHAVVCTSMFFALLLKVNVTGESNSSQEAFEITIVTAHVCMILAVVLESVVMACALRSINQQEEDPVPRVRSVRQIPVTTDTFLVLEDELYQGNEKVDKIEARIN